MKTSVATNDLVAAAQPVDHAEKADNLRPSIFSRCEHRFGNGTRCRLPARTSEENFGPLFCVRHALPPESACEDPELADVLTSGLSEFKSAAPLNDFLSRLLLLLAQNRVSPRRAAVLAYIAGQILRTLPPKDHEAESRGRGPTIIFDMPGPAHERFPADAAQLETHGPQP